MKHTTFSSKFGLTGRHFGPLEKKSTALVISLLHATEYSTEYSSSEPMRLVCLGIYPIDVPIKI